MMMLKNRKIVYDCDMEDWKLEYSVLVLNNIVYTFDYYMLFSLLLTVYLLTSDTTTVNRCGDSSFVDSKKKSVFEKLLSVSHVMTSVILSYNHFHIYFHFPLNLISMKYNQQSGGRHSEINLIYPHHSNIQMIG